MKGSKHRQEARLRLSKTYEKLNNIKEYYLHSITNQLLSENQTIVMEDLNVKGMLKNHKLAKSIQELSLNRFKTILKYKAEWYEREVIEVSRWFPSSKLCGACGYKNQELELKDRTWICPECGVIHDRDLNAARNIRNEGIRIKIGLSSPELTPQEGKPEGSRKMRKENVCDIK
jgi:putative transposase